MGKSELQKAWLTLPPNANEPEIAARLIRPVILKLLGFNINEISEQYLTGNGSDSVDIAARRNTKGDNFSHTRKDAELIIELKNRSLDISVGKTHYKNAVNQLKRYLHPNAVNCHQVDWGILTNANRIQLFRRHGKVVYPMTTNIELTAENIDEKINLIKTYIENQKRALSVTLYNNKGGVGKTTTAINLAGILSLPGKTGLKKVLLVDFDPNQKDLTDLLNVKTGKVKLFDYLKNPKNYDIRDVISQYRNSVKVSKNSRKEFGFDVIPADEQFLELSQNEVVQETGGKSVLRKALNDVKNDYDYIIIDAPPNWRHFSQEAVNASDVVLMPSKHNNLASLKNAALAVKKLFPDLGASRREIYPELADPTALPIFFNGEEISSAQKEQAEKAIKGLISQAKKETKKDLIPFFFPKYTSSRKNFDIFEIPRYAYISSSAFSNRPAVFFSKAARSYYRNLVREYFI